MAVSISFTADPPKISLFPTAVQFTNTSTGGANAWFWDFGDGGYSSELSPLYTYTTPPDSGETYTVTLRGWISADATPVPFSSYGTVLREGHVEASSISAIGGTPDDNGLWTDWVAALPSSSWSTISSLTFAYNHNLQGSSSSWGRRYDGGGFRSLSVDYTLYAPDTYIAYMTVSWSRNPTIVDVNGNLIQATVSGFPFRLDGALPSPPAGTVFLLEDFTVLVGTNVTGMWIGNVGNYGIRLPPITGWNLDQQSGYSASVTATLLGFPSSSSLGFAVLDINIFTADFSGTPRLGFDPLEVQFTDLSVPSPTNWRWDFGDDSNTIIVPGFEPKVGSTHQHPSHIYTFPDACDS